MSIHDKLIVFAPVFIGLIGVEAAVGKQRGKQLYTRGHTLASIAISVGQRIIDALPLIVLFGFVGSIAWKFRIYEMPTNVWWYIPVLFLAEEFGYYWFHRMSHDSRWFWGDHSVHHSTEQMNILASYRFGWTSWLSGAAAVFMFAPLIFLGFQPSHVATVLVFNLMYQSWLHTTLVPPLGPLEKIFNTPSNHRVHHAKNADYLDRNHGGVIMLYDHIFGTYQAERADEPVEFGRIGAKTNMTNPIEIAFHEWKNMAKDIWTWRAKPWHWPALLFGPPGWTPDGSRMTSKQLRAAYRKERFGEKIDVQPTPQDIPTGAGVAASPAYQPAE